MNYFCRLFGAAILIAILIGCEENFSPKEDFEEVYVLNCIIRNGTELQTAVILKSFDVDGFDPEQNIANPFVENVDISLSYLGETYSFNDTLISPIIDQRFEGVFKYYSLENFEPTRDYTDLEIKALLPNGKELKAKAKTPIAINFGGNKPTTNIPPSDNSSFIRVFWQARTYRYYQYYDARLVIRYKLLEDGVFIDKQIEVPSSIKQVDGKEVFEYPALTRQISKQYSMELFEKAMNKISEGIPNKKDIYIDKIVTFELSVLDANTAAYYFASNTENIYTVRVDKNIYSNIEGGYGIFGSIWYYDHRIILDEGYISRFGYNIDK